MGNTESKQRYGVDLTHAKQVYDFLADKTLWDVMTGDQQQPKQPKELVYFTTKDDAVECVHKLIHHNIHSAPVFDPDDNQWIGLLDWKDLAAYVCKLFQPEADNTVIEILKSKTPVAIFSNLSHQNPYFPINDDASLITVLSGFGPNGVHRRAVITNNDPQKIIGIVSQSRVVAWLAEHKHELGPALDRTITSVVEQEKTSPYIRKLGLVCSVLEDTPMTEVLNALVTNKITGIAVVNSQGKLLANISVSDLKYMIAKDLDNLLLTAGKFIEHVPRRPLVTCSPRASLGEVIDTLAKERVSRIYVTTPDNEPEAVITLTDVFSALMLISTQEGATADGSCKQ